MRRLVFLSGFLLSLYLAGQTDQPSDLIRKKLGQDAVIQGYPCMHGYAFFYPSGRLNRCFVSHQTAFGEAQLPSGSVIDLWPDGAVKDAMLAHDATVEGYDVSGGSFLGPSEGAVTTFYRSGKLHTAYLVHNQSIQGVPCRGSQLSIFTDPINGGNFIVLYPDGKLRACKVTLDYGGQKPGHRVVLPDLLADQDR